jgi:hypothetical protein
MNCHPLAGNLSQQMKVYGVPKSRLVQFGVAPVG